METVNGNVSNFTTQPDNIRAFRIGPGHQPKYDRCTKTKKSTLLEDHEHTCIGHAGHEIEITHDKDGNETGTKIHDHFCTKCRMWWHEQHHQEKMQILGKGNRWTNRKIN